MGSLLASNWFSTQNHSVLHCTPYIAVHDEMMLQVRNKWSRDGPARARNRISQGMRLVLSACPKPPVSQDNGTRGVEQPWDSGVRAINCIDMTAIRTIAALTPRALLGIE